MTQVPVHVGDGANGPVPSLKAIDLADPDLYTAGDGMRVLKLVQQQAPVFWNRRPNGTGFWALLRHADALQVYAQPQSFTSERGMQVGQEEAAARAAAGRMLIVTDGSRHTQLREAMNPLLTPATIRRLEEPMRAVVRESLIRSAAHESFDFVAEVAGPLPLSVICQLLGVPREHWALMIDWTRTAFGSSATDHVISNVEKSAANANIFGYYTDLLEQRRREPGGDIISALIRSSIDGVPLSDEEILLNINGLITGGNETTRHASAGAAIAFATFSDQWQRLKAEPGLTRTAVEEVLRWTAPSLNVMRTALTDTTVGSQRIRAGERVSIWNPAVNRDPAAFPRADTFDIARNPNRHLTFGMGRHLCIGAALARFELSVLLSEMARVVQAIELTGPIKRLRSNLMWGVDRVPVHIELKARL